jgi:hypothetical protein
MSGMLETKAVAYCQAKKVMGLDHRTFLVRALPSIAHMPNPGFSERVAIRDLATKI